MQSYSELGRVSLGSALRILADTITHDAATIYETFGVEIDPKWFPVFYYLASNGHGSIMNIAKEIGHSHVSVSKIVKEMKAAKLVKATKSRTDQRMTLLTLSPKAEKMVPDLVAQCEAIDKVLGNLFSETGIDLWQAVNTTARHLKYRNLATRTHDIINNKATHSIQIIDYAPHYSEAFKALNESWIKAHWELEESDNKALNHPESYILQQGGHILIAVDNGKAIGTCALIKMDDQCYELAKMTVSAEYRSRGIGTLLGEATLERARVIGAKRIYLESNSTLEPAVNLYKKLGFTDINNQQSPYARCNIQMEKYIS